MKRAASSILAAFAITVGFPGGATAAAPIKTTIDLGGLGSSVTVFNGVLKSPNPRCRSARTVKLFLTYSTGERLVDTGISSAAGAFGLAGDTSGASAGRVFVPKKNIGTRRHPKHCKAAGLILD